MRLFHSKKAEETSHTSNEPPQYDDVAGPSSHAQPLRVQVQLQYDPKFEERRKGFNNHVTAAFPHGIVVFTFYFPTVLGILVELEQLLVARADEVFTTDSKRHCNTSYSLESFKMHKGAMKDTTPERAQELYNHAKDAYPLGVDKLRTQL